MRDKLQAIIASEDTKKPLTDTELCKELHVSREYVTLLRKELNIFDSRERKKMYVYKEIKTILRGQHAVSEQNLLKMLRLKGYSLSKYLLDKYLEELSPNKIREDTLVGLPQPDAEVEEVKEYDSFNNLVGYDGSLDMQIQQAKATMLYPPRGLHCLILGETGVGKSELAEAMYRFALEVECLPKEAPFIVFNCADYAENSQLLITQLFGCMKGAYTGAVNDRKGLIEQADGGILFLDEVHRLSSEGQEMLFQLMDKGVFRRLGESDAGRKAKVQLIAATTENIETSLLSTFKRRIPMLITVPSLMDRPLTERLQLIRRFFSYESARMSAPLYVGLDVVKAYLLYDCKGNIGQLKSDIQVTCAKSFLSYVTKKEDAVKVDIHDLNLYVKKGLMKINSQRQELESIIWTDFRFHPAHCKDPSPQDDDIYSFPKEFYGTIEKAYAKYLEKGLDVQQINQLIGDEIEKKLQTVITHVKHHLVPLSLDEVAKVVGGDVIELVEGILLIAEKDLGKLDKSVAYCLAIHLHATFIRTRQGKKIINPNLEDIRRKFQKEYAVAEKMVKQIQSAYGMELPEDEIGYIALYLRGSTKEEEGRVGIIVATHGSAGGCMLDIAGKLLNIEHGHSFAMSFEENPEDALERLLLMVENCDEGKGVLLLVDMGSLLTFGEIIQECTKISVETIDRVDTIMVIEALRRSILPGTNLQDMIYGIEGLNYTFPKTKHIAVHKVRRKAIVTLCFTGEGIALFCEQQLKQMLGERLRDITLLHMGMIGERDIYKQIQETLLKYEIIAIVGSVDPKFHGIPYISMDEFFSGHGADYLRSILHAHPEKKTRLELTEKIPEVVRQIKIVMLGDQVYTKEEILKEMCGKLAQEGYVKSGYTAAVFEREKMGSYLISQKVALPHADSRYVQKPVIMIAKADQPILWDGVNTTKLICLLALDIDGKDGVRYLYKKFQNTDIVAALENAATEEVLREALL